MKVIDEKGQTIDLPDDQAWAGAVSGQYGFAPGQQVPVRAKDGTIGSIPAEDLQSALAEGYQPTSEAELAAATQRAAHETLPGAITAAAAGAGRGATFGLSDLAIRELGGKGAAEYVEGARQAFPVLSTGAEVAGATLPLLGSGGTSAPESAGAMARAARTGWSALSAPARGVARLGEATEAAIAARLGAEADAFLVRGAQAILPGVARGAVEGAAQGIGGAITEYSLSNKDLTAEALLHHVGTGALIGAGLGGVIAGAGFASSEARAAIAKRIEGMSADGALDAVVDIYAKTSGFLSNKDPEAIKRLLKDKEFRARAVQDPIAVVHESAFDVAKEAVAMDDTVRAIHQDVWGSGKAQQMRAMIPKENFIAIREEAQKLVDQGRMIQREMEGKPLVYTQQRRVEKLGEILDYLDTQITDSALQKDAASHVFNQINWAKQKIGRLAKTSQMPGIEEAAAERLQTDIYDNLFKPFLEREDLFGAAAVAQREVNALSRPSFGSGKAFDRNFSKGTGKIDPHQEWLEITEADPGKIANALEAFGTPQGSINGQILKAHGENTITALEAYKTHYALDASVVSKIDKGIAAAKTYLGSLDRAGQHVEALRTLQSIERGAQSPGLALDVAGAVLGGGAGFAVGTAAKKAVDLLYQPGNVVRKIATLERLTGALEGKIEGGLSGLLSKSKDAGRVLKREAVPAAVRALGTTPDDRRKNLEKKRLEIQAAIANPTRATAHLEHIGDAAPGVMDRAKVIDVARARFLASKLPQSTTRPGLQPNVAAAKAKIPDSEVAKFGRYLEAVKNPLGVLDDLKRGNATREGIETLKAIAPATYAEVQKRAIARVADMDAKGKPLSYEQRIALASLLDIPADPSRAPDFVAAIQQVYQASQQQPQQQQAPKRVSAAATNQIKPERSASAADTIERGLV